MNYIIHIIYIHILTMESWIFAFHYKNIFKQGSDIKN